MEIIHKIPGAKLKFLTFKELEVVILVFEWIFLNAFNCLRRTWTILVTINSGILTKSRKGWKILIFLNKLCEKPWLC